MLSEQIWTDTGFNTQPPEGGWLPVRLSKKLKSCFNTQPPEGGWDALWDVAFNTFCFNTQPPEGGWLAVINVTSMVSLVSTHSRPKAAG